MNCASRNFLGLPYAYSSIVSRHVAGGGCSNLIGSCRDIVCLLQLIYSRISTSKVEQNSKFCVYACYTNGNMEAPKQSEFENLRNNGYGPVLEKRRDTEDISGRAFTEKTQNDPQSTTEKKAPEPNKGMTRRAFLQRFAAAAGVAAVPGEIDEPLDHGLVEPSDSTTASESVEVVMQNEQFEKIKAGWQQWWTLPYDEIGFTDTEGKPVGEPVAFQKYVVEKDGKPYALLPGAVDEDGLLTEGLAGEWIDHVKKEVAKKSGVPAEELELVPHTSNILAALDNEDEPELIAALRSGEAKSLEDIVRYFGMNEEKVVRGDDYSRARSEYLYDEIDLSDLPPVIAEEVRAHIVGLVAKESRFDAGLKKNAKSAQQALQLTDDARIDHLFARTNDMSDAEAAAEKARVADLRLSFIEEVDIAGKHFANLYQRVPHWINNTYVKNSEGKNKEVERDKDYLSIIRSCFASEADWQKYFLAPAMITAYNSGARRAGEAVAFFVRDNQERLEKEWQNTQGYDLFLEMSQYAKGSQEGLLAGYGDDVVGYFPSIATAKDVFQNDVNKFG